jgi:hypothetical protein
MLEAQQYVSGVSIADSNGDEFSYNVLEERG